MIILIKRKSNSKPKAKYIPLTNFMKKKKTPIILKTCPQCKQRYVKSKYSFKKEGDVIIREEKCPTCGFTLSSKKYKKE